MIGRVCFSSPSSASTLQCVAANVMSDTQSADSQRHTSDRRRRPPSVQNSRPTYLTGCLLARLDRPTTAIRCPGSRSSRHALAPGHGRARPPTDGRTMPAGSGAAVPSSPPIPPSRQSSQSVVRPALLAEYSRRRRRRRRAAYVRGRCYTCACCTSVARNAAGTTLRRAEFFRGRREQRGRVRVWKQSKDHRPCSGPYSTQT